MEEMDAGMWFKLTKVQNCLWTYGDDAWKNFAEKIDNEAWERAIPIVPGKAGDFFDVPSGTIHAIGGGIVDSWRRNKIRMFNLPRL